MTEPTMVPRDRTILSVAKAVAWVGLAFAAIGGVVGAAHPFQPGNGVPAQTFTEIAGARFEGAVEIADPSPLLVGVYLLSVLVATGGQVIIMVALLRLVATARAGEAFLPGMREALVLVGLGIVVWTVGADLLPGVTSAIASRDMPDRFEFFATIGFAPILIIVVLGVIAAVFDVGARLRRDSEGLV